MASNLNESDNINSNVSDLDSNHYENESSWKRVGENSSLLSSDNIINNHPYWMISDVVVFEEDVDERIKWEPESTLLTK